MGTLGRTYATTSLPCEGGYPLLRRASSTDGHWRCCGLGAQGPGLGNCDVSRPRAHAPRPCVPSLSRRLSNHLLERYDAFHDLEPTVHAQREHPTLHRGNLELFARCIVEDVLPQLGGHRHHFVETLPALHAYAVAVIATTTLEERQLADG